MVKMHDKKKIGRVSYVVLWFLFSVFVLIGFFNDIPNQFYRDTREGLVKLEPTSKVEKEDGTWEYTIDVRESARLSEYVMFYTNHQVVYAYANNRLCYSLLPQNSIWGHSTGSTWNSFKIPNGSSVLRVVTKRVYTEMGNIESVFFAGEPSAMTRSVVDDSMAGVMVSLSIVVCGVILFVYWLSTGENRDKILAVFYFSIFSIVVGVWSLGETQAAMVLVHNRPVASYLGYMCMYFVCVPFVMFVRYFLHAKERFFYKIFFVIWLVSLFICNFLQFINVKDMKQTAFVLHGILAIGLVYCVYLLIEGFVRREHIRECVICSIGLVCIVLTYLVDLVWFYMVSTHTNQTGKFGFLLFVLLLGFETTRNGQANVREARLMSFYKDLAEKDVLSGCYNRNAFDAEIEALDKIDVDYKGSITIFTFDLNNLKECNDNLGHAVGDRYIKDAAALLHKVFGQNEKVYRIGGDEFCVIKKSVSEEKAKSWCKTIEEHRFVYDHGQEVSCRVASGYATFDQLEDVNLEITRDRADSLMYKNKKKMKES